MDALADRLIAWFDAHARDLPWRRADAGPWGVLVSEVMLQQTPVSRVEPIWCQWLARWPTPGDLAADPPAEAIRARGRPRDPPPGPRPPPGATPEGGPPRRA